MHHQRTWWDEQRDQDDKFQAALRAAGMVEGVVTTPSTDAPRTMAPESQGRVRSNMDFI
jgi:hypothetical protein